MEFSKKIIIWIPYILVDGTLGTAASNSLACLNRHGFIIFASLPVVLHAVKCQASSNDRYVSVNPITRYPRLTIGSINAMIIKHRMRLIRQPIDQILFVILELELCSSIITNLHTALCSMLRGYY